MILGLITTLCTPGIAAKLVGLLKIGVAGAAPAISIGTVIVQTAPLTLALATTWLVLRRFYPPEPPLDPAESGGVVVSHKDPEWWRTWPFDAFLQCGFCAVVLLTTTFLSNAAGMATGVSLSHVWDDSRGRPKKALFSFGYQYLEAYGVSAFVSAFVVAYFLARWYSAYAPRWPRVKTHPTKSITAS